MAKSNKGSGQRTNTTSASGQKANSPTSTAHKGSRVEPSHLKEQAKGVRNNKMAMQVIKQSSKKKG
jgi:hypothetical protein